MVILTDIYAPPPEEPVAGINSANLAERIRYHQHGKPVYHIGDQREVAPFLAQWLSQEDLVLVMGGRADLARGPSVTPGGVSC